MKPTARRSLSLWRSPWIYPIPTEQLWASTHYGIMVLLGQLRALKRRHSMQSSFADTLNETSTRRHVLLLRRHITDSSMASSSYLETDLSLGSRLSAVSKTCHDIDKVVRSSIIFSAV